jgi:hypothetical protein
MKDQQSTAGGVAGAPVPLTAAAVIAAVVVTFVVYANLSFAVTDRTVYRFFPPFLAGVNDNANLGLGGENFHIAQALARGRGFADPFSEPTGPTAWQPPLLPGFLAGVLLATDRNPACVAAVVICLNALVLTMTGLLIVALARQTTSRVGTGAAVLVFVVALLYQFEHCFQRTHDAWLVLLSLDLLLAGLCWSRPLARRPGRFSALVYALWGLLCGLGALVSPVVGLTWAALSLVTGVRERAWFGLAVTALAAGLTLAPWTLRNYLTFGRLIPMKSNLALELYQTQCLQADGILQSFKGHPGDAGSPERREYRALGETAYMDRKWDQFRQAVRKDPLDFLDRVASRALCATLWYVPFNRPLEARQPWLLWFKRVLHPLPFLALLVLAGTAAARPLHRLQWIAIGIYGFQLLPYVAASYYERYTVPLLAVKVLLVIWAVDRLLCLRRVPEPARCR